MTSLIRQTNPQVLNPDRKRPDRRERRRTETRERILRAALRLFSEHGLAATTVEDITEVADIGKGTFFNYFPTKEDILVHLCQLQMGKIRDFVSKATRTKEPMDAVFFELGMILTGEFGRSPALVQGILAALFSSESARQRMADDFVRDRLILAELMEARQNRGEMRNDFTPIELALQFQRALFGTTVLWSLDPSKPLTDCLKEMATVLWAGIGIESSGEPVESQKDPPERL
jgi:AcrR family transcriptional regulator